MFAPTLREVSRSPEGRQDFGAAQPRVKWPRCWYLKHTTGVSSRGVVYFPVVAVEVWFRYRQDAYPASRSYL